MESHVRRVTLRGGRPLLDRRLAQGGMVIVGAFATAAVLAALYGPGPRRAMGLGGPVAPVETAAAAATSSREVATNGDEAVAREAARRMIAEGLKCQALEAAISQSTAATRGIGLAAPAPASRPAPVPLDEPDFEKLAKKAAEAIRIGDIAGARLVLEHAASVGDNRAIYALAETYDPKVLAKLHVRGMTGNAIKARVLYEQALAKGITTARAKLIPAGK